MAKFNLSKIMKDTKISPNTVSKFQFHSPITSCHIWHPSEGSYVTRSNMLAQSKCSSCSISCPQHHLLHLRVQGPLERGTLEQHSAETREGSDFYPNIVTPLWRHSCTGHSQVGLLLPFFISFNRFHLSVIRLPKTWWVSVPESALDLHGSPNIHMWCFSI